MNRLVVPILSIIFIVSIVSMIIRMKHKQQKEFQKMRDFQNKTIATLERNITELKNTLKFQ